MTKTCPQTLPRPVLPSLPAVIFNFLQATDEDRKSVKELAEIAGSDPALCTQILKVANSALVSPGQPVKSLTQAALNLGISTLRHVAVTAAVCQTLSAIEVPDSFSMARFWRHSISCGLLCKLITSSVGLPFSEEEAFLAGLLHDIGQLCLVMERPNDFDKIVQNPRTGQTILGSEKRIWNKDHAQEGYNLLKKWHLPISIRTAVRFHHEAPERLIDSTPFLKMVYLSDISAHYVNKECTLSIEELKSQYGHMGFPLKTKAIEQICNQTLSLLSTTAKELGLIINDEGHIKAKAEQDKQSLLKAKCIDLSTLVGVLESLLNVKSKNELHNTIFTAIAGLTDIQSAIIFSYQDDCLKGVAARGTEDDSLASQIHIINLNDSIWDKAFELGGAIYSGDFFKTIKCKIVDRQLKEYLGSDFLVLPLLAGKERIGALAIGIAKGQWQELKDGRSLLELLAREMAHVLRGISYRELWEKEHILNKIVVKKCPIGVAITDQNGHVLYLNSSAKKILGLGPELLAQRSLCQILGLKKDQFIDLLPHSNKDIKFLEKRKIKLPNGKIKWIDVKTCFLSKQEPEKYLFFLTDVTDSVCLEAERKNRALWLEKELVKKTIELKKAQERLIHTERMGAASEMARKVVHEVNNPLGIIKNLLKILKIQKETGKIEDKTIDAIGSEIDRVARIVRRLSDFSKNAASVASASFHKTHTDLKEVLSEILLLVGPGLSEKNIKINTDLPDDLPKVAISKDELKQVLINLFKNSEEAIGEKGSIHIRAHTENKNVIIEFADTGPGIPEEFKDKIFDPFITTKGGGENSGLGLSVCYGLIKACGGEISLDEKEGFGAFFRIRLPITGPND